MVFIFIVLAVVFPFIAFLIIRRIVLPRSHEIILNNLRQGNNETALLVSQGLYKKYQDDIEVKLLYSKALIANKLLDEAIETLNDAHQTEHFSDVAFELDFRRTYAYLLLHLNKDDEAIEEYKILLKIAAENPDINFEMGQIYEKKCSFDDAVNYYQTAIKYNEHHTNSHKALGILYLKSQKYEEAKRSFEAAIFTTPEDTALHYYLGRALRCLHNYNNAIKTLERCSRDKNLRHKAAIEEGLCYLATDNEARAITCFSQVLKSSENLSKTEILYSRYFLASAYEKAKQIADAIIQWKIIYTANPKFQDVRVKLNTYNQLPQHEKKAQKFVFDNVTETVNGEERKVATRKFMKEGDLISPAVRDGIIPKTKSVEDKDKYLKFYSELSEEIFFDLCLMVAQDAMELDTKKIELFPNGCRIFAVSKDAKRVCVGFFRKNAFDNPEICRNFKFQMQRNKIAAATFFFNSVFPKAVVDFAEKNSIKCMSVDVLVEKIAQIYEKFLKKQEEQK